jgi:hypothetical protein
MSSSSTSSSSSPLTGVCIPVYDLAPGPVLKAVEHAFRVRVRVGLGLGYNRIHYVQQKFFPFF